MNIQNEEQDTKGAFFIEKDGERIAEMTYRKMGTDRIIIDHTEVNDPLKGEGVGKQLVEAGVKFARKNNLKIVPQCVFAKKIIDRMPEFQDVLAQ
jgi:predicted GNAT family acetyltransferase